jgi:DNA end-binding protein Ku
MWKGSISFGLVNIPVNMYAATEDKDIKFRYLHRDCHTPIKYVRTCPNCNKEVEMEEIVKGFEYEPGRFVIVKDEELNAISPEKSKTVDIIDFVNLNEIDPIYFNKSYFLAPNETGTKAFGLLKKAMEETGKIAVAKMMIRSSQTLAVIRVYQKGLLLETIFFPDEVRSQQMVPNLPDEAAVDEKELAIATQLIDQLSVPFEPDKYTDDYRIALTEMIQRKIEGEEIEEAPKVAKANIVDLMDALQASLEAAKTGDEKKPAARKKRSKKGTKAKEKTS